MKITKTASGKKTIKLSKQEWMAIGKKAGWMKEASSPEIQDFIDRFLKGDFIWNDVPVELEDAVRQGIDEQAERMPVKEINPEIYEAALNRIDMHDDPGADFEVKPGYLANAVEIVENWNEENGAVKIYPYKDES